MPYEETGSLPMQQFHREDATSFLGLMTQSLELSPHSSGDQTGVLMLDSKAEITENHMQEGLYIGSELNLEGIFIYVTKCLLDDSLCFLLA